jgi:hypothetical protein
LRDDLNLKNKVFILGWRRTDVAEILKASYIFALDNYFGRDAMYLLLRLCVAL